MTSGVAISRRAIEEYLIALFADAPEGALAEVRMRTAGGMRQAFHHVSDCGAIAAAIASQAPHTDVYIGVVPRLHRRGGRDDLVGEAGVLWVDCDNSQSAAALRSASPPASMIVASGTGDNAHGYWLLSQPAPLDTIEAANRQLAARFGADPACADAARILRPPSLNHKHTPPAPVRLEVCEPARTYSIEEAAGAPVLAVAPRRPLRVAPDDPLLSIEPAVYVERLCGERIPRFRKIRCPFHGDGAPSLHVYRSAERGWYCYGCRLGGSIYDFAAHLWGLETRGARFVEIHDALCGAFGPEDLSQPQ
jgi:hypothetical protein